MLRAACFALSGVVKRNACLQQSRNELIDNCSAVLRHPAAGVAAIKCTGRSSLYREFSGLPNQLLEKPTHSSLSVAWKLLTRSAQVSLVIGAPLVVSQLWPSHSTGCSASIPVSRTEYPTHPAEVLSFRQRIPQLLHHAAVVLVDETWTALRGAYLLLLFLPSVVCLPLFYINEKGRKQWITLLRRTLESAGPAFIKWGQWAATRPDLFPPDICAALSRLHSSAPAHSFRHTRKAVERAFEQPLERIFQEFSRKPLASGSIAQVHRATLSANGARFSGYPAGTVVAVKVRHPRVSSMMNRDFKLMQRMANVAKRLPPLASLHLDESVRQFGAPMREQLDLSLEAHHLCRFNYNFRHWRNLTFPKPIFPLVAPSVLVETFEPGRLISNYVDNPSLTRSAKLANIGLSSYLKMLLKDNFIHADLHPGNILVRLKDPNTLTGRLNWLLQRTQPPQLVLLDVGMIAQLTDDDQDHLVRFFRAITEKNGKELAENILAFSETQTCPDPQAFIEDLTELFRGLDWDTISKQTGDVIADMMEQVRRHEVNLKGVVSTVVVTTLVLEGWSSKLDPDLRIMDSLKAMLSTNWFSRLYELAVAT